jgi:hypothetical protein
MIKVNLFFQDVIYLTTQTVRTITSKYRLKISKKVHVGSCGLWLILFQPRHSTYTAHSVICRFSPSITKPRVTAFG